MTEKLPETNSMMTILGSSMRYISPGKISGSYCGGQQVNGKEGQRVPRNRSKRAQRVALSRTEQYLELAAAIPSNRMGKPYPPFATMFWMPKSTNRAGAESLWTSRVSFLAEIRASSSFLAPVTTTCGDDSASVYSAALGCTVGRAWPHTLPEANNSPVALGSRSRKIHALKRLGLYSAFRACVAILVKSSGVCKLTVATQFLGRGGERGVRA